MYGKRGFPRYWAAPRTEFSSHLQTTRDMQISSTIIDFYGILPNMNIFLFVLRWTCCFFFSCTFAPPFLRLSFLHSHMAHLLRNLQINMYVSHRTSFHRVSVLSKKRFTSKIRKSQFAGGWFYQGSRQRIKEGAFVSSALTSLACPPLFEAKNAGSITPTRLHSLYY